MPLKGTTRDRSAADEHARRPQRMPRRNTPTAPVLYNNDSQHYNIRDIGATTGQPSHATSDSHAITPPLPVIDLFPAIILPLPHLLLFLFISLSCHRLEVALPSRLGAMALSPHQGGPPPQADRTEAHHKAASGTQATQRPAADRLRREKERRGHTRHAAGRRTGRQGEGRNEEAARAEET